MKKQYVFLGMIIIILYIFYLILSKSYYEYKINSHIDSINAINNEIKNDILKAKEIIEYKSSKAYKNKILKEQQSFKNKWETVIYITTKSKYDKFTKTIQNYKEINKNVWIKKINNNIEGMTIYQKWLYFIFKKDTY